MAYDKKDDSALKRGYRASRGMWNIRLAPFYQRCTPRVPIVDRDIHASRYWF